MSAGHEAAPAPTIVFSLLSLSFSEPDFESAFRASVFRGSFMPSMVLLILWFLVVFYLSLPPPFGPEHHTPGGWMLAPIFSLSFAGRYWLHTRPDPAQAPTIFAHFFTGLILFTTTAYHAMCFATSYIDEDGRRTCGEKADQRRGARVWEPASAE